MKIYSFYKKDENRNVYKKATFYNKIVDFFKDGQIAFCCLAMSILFLVVAIFV